MKKISFFLIASVLALTAYKQTDKQQQNSQEQLVKQTQNNLELHQHDATIQLNSETLYACPMNTEYLTSDPDTRCTKCGMHLKPLQQVNASYNIASAKLYSCSMHPEYLTSEETDRCPMCGMAVSAG